MAEHRSAGHAPGRLAQGFCTSLALVTGLCFAAAAAVLALLNVLLVLTTILPPILRRAQPVARPEPSSNGNAGPADEFLATAVIQIADKIDVLNGGPGNRAAEIQAEVDRLGKLAQSFEI